MFFDWLSRIPFRCLFHHLTGFPCPLCGGTRGVLALFSGNFVQAITYNPATFFAVVIGMVYLIVGLWGKKRTGVFPSLMPSDAVVRKRVGVLLGVLVMLNWVFLIWQGV